MQIQPMISTHPDVRGSVNESLVLAIEAAYGCAAVCRICADACLAEEMVADLRQCIRFNLDCSDLCATTGIVASRRTGSNELVIKRLIETCAEACRLCAEECEGHAAKMEHCRICAEACRRCETACQDAIATVGSGLH